MLQQEKEFKSWGLSKLAIRNIVVGFISFLVIDSVMLRRTITLKDDEIGRLNVKVEDCKSEMITVVERLKDDMISYITGLEKKQDSSIVNNSQIIDENQRVIRITKNKIR